MCSGFSLAISKDHAKRSVLAISMKKDPRGLVGRFLARGAEG
jgi:hypothetical protein